MKETKIVYLTPKQLAAVKRALEYVVEDDGFLEITCEEGEFTEADALEAYTAVCKGERS